MQKDWKMWLSLGLWSNGTSTALLSWNSPREQFSSTLWSHSRTISSSACFFQFNLTKKLLLSTFATFWDHFCLKSSGFVIWRRSSTRDPDLSQFQSIGMSLRISSESKEILRNLKKFCFNFFVQTSKRLSFQTTWNSTLVENKWALEWTILQYGWNHYGISQVCSERHRIQPLLGTLQREWRARGVEHEVSCLKASRKFIQLPPSDWIKTDCRWCRGRKAPSTLSGPRISLKDMKRSFMVTTWMLTTLMFRAGS